MSNTHSSELKRVLHHLLDGEINWIHDQLDGTSFVKESLEKVDKAENEAIAAIEKLMVLQRIAELKLWKPLGKRQGDMDGNHMWSHEILKRIAELQKQLEEKA